MFISNVRVKSVVNTYDIYEHDDETIEKSFEESVNTVLAELEEAGHNVINIGLTTQVTCDTLLKCCDIHYKLAEQHSEEEPEKEEIEEEAPVVMRPRKEVPEVGEHPRKVTEEVFNFIQAKYESGSTEDEIVDLFVDKLSIYTIKKVLKTNTFSEYYKD